ncbi:MAG: F0F1 ATP synthase subunit C [Xanthomonadales bacterium]|nr:F0F1 ATP synthase subunit C [Xanthomonadales bacterium]|tara:strand:- start:521 stop:805 length:285 start_codon:yes stop_codon:yes gene_type:complete
MDPQAVAMVYAYTATGVGIILGLAGLGSALGWGLICSRFIEAIARQPELRAQLTGQMLFVGGLMEAFPFIVLGMSMWFTFANPFLSGLQAAVGG